MTGGWAASIVLRNGGGNMHGMLADARECFVVDVSELPHDEPERSLRILELLVRGFGYQAQVSLCDRGYISPDIVETYGVRVIIEGTDE